MLSKFYGRRRGRPLSKDKQLLLQELLPKVALDLVEQEVWHHRIAKAPKVVLEIGFGGGEHLAQQAANDKDTLFVGAEVFLNGISSLLKQIQANDLANILIFPEDILQLLPHLPSAVLDEVIILFPAPWPKKRHNKRRLINNHFLKMLEPLLKETATLKLASDDQDYIQQMREVLTQNKNFAVIYDKDTAPASWFTTRYEHKAQKANRMCTYLIYQYIGRAL